MPRFVRSLPETVRAVQWRPGRRLAGIVMERPASAGGTTLLPVPAHAVLTTQHGPFTVFTGDWIVTEPTGHRQVVPNGCFEQRYVALKGFHGLFVRQETRDESAHAETSQP